MTSKLKQTGFKALLVTQFLEAFNDNALKFVVIFVAIDYFTKQGMGTFFVALAGAVFILPFILFSTFAGFLADRFSKKNIIVIAKVAELLILTGGMAAFIHINMYGMLAVLFCMGLHSAFLSPSKYAILPEILDPDELSEGNGQIQLWTYAAIILGQASGGYLLKVFGSAIYKAYFVFMGLAFVGIVTSLFITNVPPSGSRRPPRWNVLGEVFENLGWIKSYQAIYLSVLGLVYFSFLGGIFQPNIQLYAHQMIQVDVLLTSILLISISVGIGLGSFMAGRFSDQKIELGLVPLGAIGISILSVLLGVSYHSYALSLAVLFALGIFSGFYIVPLNTLVQKESPSDARGRVVATNNFLSFSAILLASGVIYLLGEVLKFNPAHTFVVMGVMTIIGTIYICRILPYPLVRLIVWILAHTVYKIRAIDKDRVPEKGGVLIVANHVSFMDAVLLVVTVPRPMRFIMSREVYNVWWLRPICKIGRAIPIDRKDNPKEIIRTFQTAREALKAGEIVCIFPEGQLTRTGNMNKFHAGVEHIIKGTDCPIVPVHLDRIWGSIFSFEGGKFMGKWPKVLPYPVTISFGEPVPPTTTAFELRSRVMELGAETFQYRLEGQWTMSEAFWRQARRNWGKFCIADSAGKKLNYAMTLISAVAIARKLRVQLDQEKNVGVLLPPSVGGALTNIAVSILNKVPVNINYTASKDAVASIVRQCAMQYVITSRVFLEKLGLEINAEKIFIEDVIAGTSKLDRVRAALLSFAPSPLSRRLIFGPKAYRQHEKIATVMFTSGSTGEPKGVVLTDGNVTSNLQGLYQVFNVQDEDVMMGVLPFFHSFGFTGTLWFPLLSGTGAVYHVNPLDAKVIGKLVEQYKATILMTTPTFLSSYMRRCEPAQFKSLRIVIVGAEKLKEALAEEFKTKFVIEPMEGYGCTELSPVAAINLPDHEHQRAHKSGTIGLPLPGIAVRVVDPATMAPLGPNESGLLLIKGPNVMKGYLNQPEKTREVIKDGWYVTGDVAQIDEDGFIRITDRLSRFSKIGGEMVPHVKVEEEILKQLKSTEQICVVTSVPDEKKGEKLVVLHTVDLNVDELIDNLKKAGLPNLWIPDADFFCKIDAVPVLGTGKMDLKGVKEMARKLKGAGG